MIIIPESKREQIINDFVPDLTPLLDIIFMLVVFLLLTTNLASYSIHVDLPENIEGNIVSGQKEEDVSITVLPMGQGWRLGDLSYHKEENFYTDLLKRIQQKKEKRKVVIICDKSVHIEKFLKVISFLKRNQIKTTEIIVKKSETHR